MPLSCFVPQLQKQVRLKEQANFRKNKKVQETERESCNDFWAKRQTVLLLWPVDKRI